MDIKTVVAIGEGIASVIKPVTDKLSARVAALEARLAEVEGKGIAYRGVWQKAEGYKRGDAVTSAGSLWIATKDQPLDVPGARAADWQLAVKRGADGGTVKRGAGR